MDERTLLSRISINPKVCGGRPCIRGHRIPVELVLDLLASGVTPREICRTWYPSLGLQDVSACVAFANRFVQLIRAEDLPTPSEPSAARR